ncbi:MAG: AraC family transcriptional regulator [Schaedlerella sp.]|nr:AraC family transcriptional regulator [Schaedlerella sp.]
MIFRKDRTLLKQSQKELQSHGTVAFPCATYEFYCSEALENNILWHWHEELEIILIIEGTLELRISGETFSVHPGDLIMLNGNILHSAVGTPEGLLQSFVFSPHLLTGNTDSIFSEKYIKPLMNCDSFICTISHDSENIHAFTTAFKAMSQTEFAYEFTVREELTHILLNLYRIFEPQLSDTRKIHTTDNRRIEQMLNFIHTNYQEDLSLARISKAGQIGERECLRCFKRTIAESPVQYLLKYRLMQSAHMLISQPDASISEVSSACGFDSPSYFSKQFRRYYMCTPKEYRKNNT